MWELALGERLNHRQVLSEPERRNYFEEGLNLNVVHTTEYVKPYSSSGHVNTDRDAALLEAIQDKHGEAPGLITTTTALEEYDAADVLELERNGGRFTGEVRDGSAKRVKWRGDILGSNEFKHKRLGVVIGSNHCGDGFVKKWSAYAGESVERNDGKGVDLSYGPFGNKILRHMQEHDTLQAVMRFGRDRNGAVVYVHTNTLLEWPPFVGGGRVLTTRSDGERQVLEAIKKREEWTTAEITDHPDVDIVERQVLNVLQDLTENGYLTAETEGRGYVWRADGLHRINEHGEVELESIDINSLSDDVVDEIARSSTYTCNFANYVKPVGSRCTDTMDGDGSTPVRACIKDDPPPDGTE